MSDENPLEGRSSNDETKQCAADNCRQRVPLEEQLYLQTSRGDAGDSDSMTSIYLCEGCRIAVFNEVYNENRS